MASHQQLLAQHQQLLQQTSYQALQKQSTIPKSNDYIFNDVKIIRSVKLSNCIFVNCIALNESDYATVSDDIYNMHITCIKKFTKNITRI